MDDSTSEELAVLRELVEALLEEARRTNELLQRLLDALAG
jgi:hypothetical protein